MTSIDPKPIAVVAREGRGLCFRPALRDVVTALTTRRIEAGDGSTSPAFPVSFGCVRGSGSQAECITRAGFQPLVHRMFENAGFRVSPHSPGALPRDLPLPATSCLGSRHEPPTMAFLNFVRANLEGTIRYIAGRVDFVRLIAEASLAYPGVRIVVATDSRDSGRRIARRLGRWLGRVPAFDCRPRAELLEEELPRVSVSTFIALAELDIEWGIDFLFLPNVSELIGSRAELAVNCAHHARVFGFLPNDTRLSPFEEDVARSVLGFAELLVPGHGMTPRPTEIVWSSIRGHSAACGTSIVEVLRTAVWRDPIRTRRLGSLASLLQQGDRTALHARFPDVAQALPDNFGGASNVLILCDNGEHATEFGRKLPGAQVLVGVEHDQVVQSVARSGRHRAANTRRVIRLIATRDALADGRVDLESVDVVLVAGASPHAAQIPVHLLASRELSPRPLAIVEFNDRRHPLLRRWTRSRSADYASRDVVAPGTDPLLHRVDRFILSRRDRSAP
jgi:hypothetical protein